MLPLMPVVGAESDYPNVFTHAVLDCKEESVISTLYPVSECQLHKLVHISTLIWTRLCDCVTFCIATMRYILVVFTHFVVV